MSSGHDEHGEEGHEESHDEGGHEEKHEEKHEKDDEKHAEPAAEKKPSKKKKSITESEVFILALIAILGRVLLKVTPLVNIPSVEPIIPIAVYAGLAYGVEAGAVIGLISYPISNLFIPESFFGLWILWQAVGGAIAGGLAGLAKKATFNNLVQYTVIGTIIFELAVNIPDQELLYWPFSFIHIFSNFLFAALIGIFVLKEK